MKPAVVPLLAYGRCSFSYGGASAALRRMSLKSERLAEPGNLMRDSHVPLRRAASRQAHEIQACNPQESDDDRGRQRDGQDDARRARRRAGAWVCGEVMYS